jgi:GAF domain
VRLAAGETVIVADVSTDPRYLMTHATTRSEIVVPVVDGRDVVGLIDVESDRAMPSATRTRSSSNAAPPSSFLSGVQTQLRTKWPAGGG